MTEEQKPSYEGGAVAWRFHDGAVKGPADGSSDLFDFITADGREYRAQKQPNFWHSVSLWRPHVPAHPPALGEWRDIGTAPEQGPIMVWDADNNEATIAPLRGQENSWWTENYEVWIRATHWMPLPLPPVSKE